MSSAVQENLEREQARSSGVGMTSLGLLGGGLGYLAGRPLGTVGKWGLGVLGAGAGMYGGYRMGQHLGQLRHDRIVDGIISHPESARLSVQGPYGEGGALRAAMRGMSRGAMGGYVYGDGTGDAVVLGAIGAGHAMERAAIENQRRRALVEELVGLQNSKTAGFWADARQSLATPDDPRSTWKDKTVDALSGFVPYGLGSAATAPGGRWFHTPVRQFGQAAIEGIGGGLAGAGTGALIGGIGGALLGGGEGAAAGMQAGGLIGGGIGALTGSLHGSYAARRQVRQETGDYNAFGWGENKQHKPVVSPTWSGANIGVKTSAYAGRQAALAQLGFIRG